MKKIIILLSCISIALLSGCSTQYKRISFNNENLAAPLESYVNEHTQVTNESKEIFAEHHPIYSIAKHVISKDDYSATLKQFGFTEDSHVPGQIIEYDENRIVGSLVSYSDTSRGYFDMTNDEVEELSWMILNKLPYVNGTYEYLGVRSTMTLSDSTGDHITRAGVSFRRLINGTRIVGNDTIHLYFDGSGLVEFEIELYDYKEIGSMDIVPFSDALSRVTCPDSFTIECNEPFGVINTMKVERVKLLYVNQYRNGCIILQPIYYMIGTAINEKGDQSRFSSKVIAIPDSLTYTIK